MSTAEALHLADDPRPRPTSQAGLMDLLVKVLQPIASLKVTVTLFTLSMVLVFFGTLAQMEANIWDVVAQYFWSYWVPVDLGTFGKFLGIFFTGYDVKLSGVWFPFPGGKTIGFAMFINLLAAHSIQLINLIRGVYKTAQKGKELNEVMLVLLKRTGIYMLHGGLLLLFVGEYITREFQIEQQMRIVKGSTSSMAFDTRNLELAFIVPTGPDHEDITVIPRSQLLDAEKNKSRIQHDLLPFDVEVLAYYANSDLLNRARSPEPPVFETTHGLGQKWKAVPLPPVSGVDTSNNIDVPSAYIKLYRKGTDEAVATLLVTAYSDTYMMSKPPEIPPLHVDGKDYTISLRLKRYHKPYSITLEDFTYEKYTGTEKAKNYASHIRLIDESRGVDRLATISMNNPLRYNGEAFFQHQYSETPDRTAQMTTLQVVDNPGWVLPYVSCALVTLGMTVHFLIALITFLNRMLARVKTSGTGALSTSFEPTPSAAPPPTTTPGKKSRKAEAIVTATKTTPPADAGASPSQRSFTSVFVATSLIALTALTWLIVLLPSPSDSNSNLGRIARLPVSDGGRVKPLDTVARTHLRMISHREDYKDTAGKKQPAVKLYLESGLNSVENLTVAAELPIFRIENDQVRALFKLPQREGLRYSLKELQPRNQEFQRAIENAMKKDAKSRDLFDLKVLELSRHAKSLLDFAAGHTPHMVPPTKDGQDWRSAIGVVRDAWAKADQAGFPQNRQDFTAQQIEQFLDWARDPALESWEEILSAYRANDPRRLEKAIDAHEKQLEGRVSPVDIARAQFETYLNGTAIYYWCGNIYVMAILFCMVSWLALVFSRPLAEGFRWGVLGMLAITFLAHGFMMISRMYLMDRPLVFVTNLYSSAVFIGWVSVLVCLIVEFLYPLGIGNLSACIIGAGTSIIGHNLATSGDTLEMMEAVLDTNFWLATHVTTVTFGYSATYVAGVVGLLYVGLLAFPQLLQRKLGQGQSLGYSFQENLTLDKALNHVMYGIVCLATLMSFVGTVLGGIWADQSWGRFWGWDPKENGAVLIVIWNAMILHARWAGLIKTRGLALLAIAGNMITTWSWFGTNQLSVGLHAYGFNKELALFCAGMWITHAAVIAGAGLQWFFFGRKEPSRPAPTA